MVDISAPNGVALTPVCLAIGETHLSDPIEIPPGFTRIVLDVTAEGQGGSTTAPTVTVKIRQGARGAGTLVDRAITSPTTLAAFSGQVRALALDSVVSRWVQFELACTGQAVDISAIAGLA